MGFRVTPNQGGTLPEGRLVGLGVEFLWEFWVQGAGLHVYALGCRVYLGFLVGMFPPFPKSPEKGLSYPYYNPDYGLLGFRGNIPSFEFKDFGFFFGI